MKFILISIKRCSKQHGIAHLAEYTILLSKLILSDYQRPSRTTFDKYSTFKYISLEIILLTLSFRELPQFRSASLKWRHNEGNGVSNHQPHDCLLNRFFKAQIKENIKAPRHLPLWGDFTGGRWIPHTKGQLRGKCFHLMTSSCIYVN